MPKMDGFELYRQIRKRDVQVKVCFMSAYEVFYEQFGELSKNQTIHFIKKPIDLIELKRMIQEI
jgi:two-component system catabolic regulation response regulator CreB/two-component system response regulator ChvI